MDNAPMTLKRIGISHYGNLDIDSRQGIGEDFWAVFRTRAPEKPRPRNAASVRGGKNTAEKLGHDGEAWRQAQVRKGKPAERQRTKYLAWEQEQQAFGRYKLAAICKLCGVDIEALEYAVETKAVAFEKVPCPVTGKALIMFTAEAVLGWKEKREGKHG